MITPGVGVADAMIFECDGDRLVGVLHRPLRDAASVAVLVVVGGPQYRVGSHRQFLLMARAMAAAGYPVLRFDYRGMGDSDGQYRGFEAVDRDLGAAMDALLTAVPTAAGVVLWGLCDGASAALMYASRDSRVAGVVAANTWAHSARGEARAYVNAYYGRRLLHASFWRKLLRGEVNVARSAREFLTAIWRARSKSAPAQGAVVPGFVERMQAGLAAFPKPVLLLESGRDLTVAEFVALREDDPSWRAATGRSNVSIVRLADADHTFSERHTLEQAIGHCLGWLGGLPRARPVGSMS